jgi:hypothetical protein
MRGAEGRGALWALDGHDHDLGALDERAFVCLLDPLHLERSGGRSVWLEMAVAVEHGTLAGEVTIHGNVRILVALPPLRRLVADWAQRYAVVEILIVIVRATMRLRPEVV